MEFVVHEVVPETCNRTDFGRVVVNPPNVMGPLVCRPAAKILMCCNRAFLTEESYTKHLEQKNEHGSALDFSKLPNFTMEAASKVTHNYDIANRNLWIVRKQGCANDTQSDNVKTCTTSGVSTNSVLDKEKEGRGLKICTLCKISTLGSNMSRHMKTCHVPEGIKCDFCCCTFLLHRSRLRHQRQAHGIRIRRKPGVNMKNAIIAKAKRQLVTSSKFKSTSKKKNYTCSICHKNFVSKPGLRDHMNSHSGSRPYTCDVCGDRYTHLSNLGRHKRRAHTKNDKIFCDICNCGFSNRYALASHNKTMHSNKLKVKKLQSQGLEKSNFLEKSNGSSLLLGESTKLLERATPNSDGQYECRICHKMLSTQQTLRGHMNIHYDKRPYKCNHCEVSFRLHSTRHQHILKVHSGGSFKCKSCSYCFQSKIACQRHQLKCKKADIKKSSVGNTKQEKAPSESSKKAENLSGFKCNLCGAVVRNLEDFEKHKVVHSKVHRAQCNMCLKKFGSIVNLNFHKKRAHGDVAIHVHKCDFCCCRYAASQALFSHLAKEHGMERNDWNFLEKAIRPEARRRIQVRLMRLCKVELKSEGKNKAGKTITSVLGMNDNVDRKTTKVKVMNDSNKPFECDICHQRFKLQRSIHGHKKVAHNYGAFICGLCPCRYNKITWLEKHQLKVHDCIKPPVKVDNFDRTAEKKSQKNITPPPNSPKVDDRPVKCNICKLGFKTVKCLYQHKRKSHLHSGKFKCDKCPCKFQAIQGLRVHRALYHGHIGKKKLKTTYNTINIIDNIRDVEDENMVKSHSRNDDSATDDNTNANLPEVTKKFECDLCHMKFIHRSSVNNHKKNSHFHSGKFNCTKCTCKFETAPGLINHKKVHHKYRGKQGMKQLKRNRKNDEKNSSPHNYSSGAMSGTTQPNKMNLEDKTGNEVGRVECDQCHLMVGQKQITKHKKLSHGSGSYCCSECCCVFLLPQGLRRHKVFYHAVKTVRRDAITKCMTNDETLEKENADSIPPTKVNRNFFKIRGSFLSRRTTTKISSSPQKKPPCEEQLANVQLFPVKGPSRSATVIPNYKFKCNLCGVKFTSSVNYKRHQQKAHTGGGSNCDSCSCTFNNAGALAAHKRTYHSSTGEISVIRPIKNSVKSKLAFKGKEKAPVKKSMMYGVRRKVQKSSVSTTIKPVLGTESRFRNAAILNKKDNESDENTTHQRPNDPQSIEKSSQQNPVFKKVNRCTWCRKAFSTEKLLSKHILSHTRPEVCTQCNMRFRTKDEVLKHSKIAHDERSMHQCLICSCRFTTPVGLKAHTAMIHNKESASYDNVVIEHDEGSTADNDPFITVGPSYSGQNRDNGFCEDSEPIVQGILETNYESGGYCNEEAVVTSVMQDVVVYEDSVPIVEGFVDYANSEFELPELLSQPKVNSKKSFSPKSRPIKCSTCGVTCYGPEKLRHHMESHQVTEDKQDEETMQEGVETSDYNSVKKCEMCGNQFNSTEELEQHLKLEHDESGFYRCAYCPCTMKTETNLRYHFMKYHTG